MRTQPIAHVEVFDQTSYCIGHWVIQFLEEQTQADQYTGHEKKKGQALFYPSRFDWIVRSALYMSGG